MIHILLATYNGEKYLEEQLQSIAEQTQQDWMLHVSDDRSEDGTMDILERFAVHFPDKVSISQNDNKLGAKSNFTKLLSQVREQGDYVFCDQDDIWMPDKLTTLQKRLRKEENNKTEPVLVYSDAKIIDENGKLIANSFRRRSGLKLPAEKTFQNLLLYNAVQGAASMWNYELHKLLQTVPKEALMHDWWVALVAAGHGRICRVPDCLIQYRQHTGNLVGEFNRKEWYQSFLDKLTFNKFRQLIANNHKLQKEREIQARAYMQIYPDDRIADYLEIMRRNRFVRVWQGIRRGYVFISCMYSIKYYLL